MCRLKIFNMYGVNTLRIMYIACHFYPICTIDFMLTVCILFRKLKKCSATTKVLITSGFHYCEKYSANAEYAQKLSTLLFRSSCFPWRSNASSHLHFYSSMYLCLSKKFLVCLKRKIYRAYGTNYYVSFRLKYSWVRFDSREKVQIMVNIELNM